jgi:hypothetical protein
MICNCPLGTALPDINLQDCPSEFGQLQKLVVMRVKKADGSLNEIENPEVIASWTTAKTAVDDTKVVVLPMVHNPSVTPGDSKIFGENSNETPDGAGIVMGENPTTLAGNFAQQPMNVIQQIKALECEKIGVFMINAAGQIFGKKGTETEGETPSTALKPIPIKAFFVKAPELGNSENPMKSDFQCKMDWDWYHDTMTVTPTDFDALLEL